MRLKNWNVYQSQLQAESQQLIIAFLRMRQKNRNVYQLQQQAQGHQLFQGQ
jgi:hypothetical protein